MKTIYIGRFPAPYGGVTIKNKMLYDNISKYIDIEKFDLGLVRKLNFIEIIKLFIKLVTPSNQFIIGSASTSRKFFSGLLYYINRSALNQSILIVMGGEASKVVANDKKYAKWIKEYKQIYVETEGMKSELNGVNIHNVSIFPNCRENPKINIEIKNRNKREIRLIYFSLISKEKGADIVIEAAKYLNQKGINFIIDFYGHIDKPYEAIFLEKIKNIENVKYCGVYTADRDSVYLKLNKYDIMLLPTKWTGEGVPGILVESKIAAIPSIVSDINYNSEIINNEVDGIVLKYNSHIELCNSIERLYYNDELLINMKKKSKDSSYSYLVENHIEDMIKLIKR